MVVSIIGVLVGLAIIAIAAFMDSGVGSIDCGSECMERRAETADTASSLRIAGMIFGGLGVFGIVATLVQISKATRPS
jgi:hypothetical protein